jgi:hypothetical protein
MFSRWCSLVAAAACLISTGLPASQVTREQHPESGINAGALMKLKGDLSGIDCTSDGDCQVVGAFAVSNPKHSVMAIFRTRDGGSTWVQEGLPRRSGELNAVACAADRVCWSVGSTGGFAVPRILRTTNGGATWSVQAIALRGEPMTISCATRSVCVAGGVLSKPGGTRILAPIVTRDAGAAWLPSQLASWLAGASGVSCPSTNVCEVVGTWVSSMGTTGTLGRSANGGRSWVEEKPQVHDAFITSLSSVDCTSIRDCEAVGGESSCQTITSCRSNAPSGGLALTTTDGGAQWSRGDLPTGVRSLQGVWCVSAQDCQAVGLGRSGSAVALRTTNGGTRWSMGSVPAGVGFLNAVSCQSAERCLAVGFDGASWPHLTMAVIRTSDDGVTWSR